MKDYEEMKEKWERMSIDQREDAMELAYSGSGWTTNPISSGMVKNGVFSIEYLSFNRQVELKKYLNESRKG